MEYSKHNSIVEINTRQVQLNQRDKDKQFRVNAFANKMAQYHAGDLFDIQMKCQDIAEHTRLLVPSLALNFGVPPAGAEAEMEVDG